MGFWFAEWVRPACLGLDVTTLRKAASLGKWASGQVGRQGAATGQCTVVPSGGRMLGRWWWAAVAAYSIIHFFYISYIFKFIFWWYGAGVGGGHWAA